MKVTPGAQAASRLRSTPCPRPSPTRPASKWPHGLPDTYRRIGALECFGPVPRQCRWGTAGGKPLVLRPGRRKRSAGSSLVPREQGVSLPVAGPCGSPGLPRPGWISPGLSELRRHQGEAALGYHWPGEHRRQNKHWTPSSLLGTITR